jgi:hypothetical protein
MGARAVVARAIGTGAGAASHMRLRLRTFYFTYFELRKSLDPIGHALLTRWAWFWHEVLFGTQEVLFGFKCACLNL